MTDEQKCIIKELYPYYSGQEVAIRVGSSKSQVNEYAKRNGITHTPETIERLKRKAISKLCEGHSKESYIKGSEATKRKRKYDTFLLLSGKKQNTKLRISILPQKTRRRITMLCHLYNYFKSDDRNSTVVYYDKETKRNAYAEKYANEKYGITFEEGE